MSDSGPGAMLFSCHTRFGGRGVASRGTALALHAAIRRPSAFIRVKQARRRRAFVDLVKDKDRALARHAGERKIRTEFRGLTP